MGDEKQRKKSKQAASFLCDVCKAAFNQKIHLTKHSAKHTGIKPFKCTECNYSTVERSHLKVHVRVHTGEKPFKCTICEYATAQSSTLKVIDIFFCLLGLLLFIKKYFFLIYNKISIIYRYIKNATTTTTNQVSKQPSSKVKRTSQKTNQQIKTTSKTKALVIIPRTLARAASIVKCRALVKMKPN